MIKVKQKDIIITTKLNMEEIDTILECLDYMIRDVQDNPKQKDFGTDFQSKLSEIRKDIAKIYEEAFDFKKEKEENV